MIFAKLLPQNSNFFELFNQHATHTTDAARAFAKLVANYPDVALREQFTQEVYAAEHAADRVTREVNQQLHKTFITPIDREQIFSLINTMDDVADLFQDSAETMSLYDVKHMTDDMVRLADLSVKCCERLRHVVTLIPGVAKAEIADAALRTCEEIDQLESDADRVMRSAISRLFREEEDVREVLKMKEMYQLLEMITDKCEDAANLIEGIVLENS